jgi:hypothetical protein
VTKAVVIGQSHVAAIEQTLPAHGAANVGIVIHRIRTSAQSDENTITDAQAIPLAAQVPPDVPIFLSLLGTYHNYLGLLRSGVEFDFFTEPSDTPDPDAIERIPHRAIATIFEQHLNSYALVDKLVAIARAPLFLLSPPPPKQRSDFMLDRLLQRNKKIKYGKSVDELGIERSQSRLKLWKLETALTARWGEGKGVGFVPAPSECFNADGFLARKYYFDDATHANAGYGALVLGQMLSISEKMRTKAAHG